MDPSVLGYIEQGIKRVNQLSVSRAACVQVMLTVTTS